MPEVKTVKPIQTSLLAGESHCVPSFPFEPVMTGALNRLLNADPQPKLVALTAPIGYGKTVLMGRLHRELSVRGWRCIWLTLDDRDSEVSSLLIRMHALLTSDNITKQDIEIESSGNHDEQEISNDHIIQPLRDLPGVTALFIDNLGFCTDPNLGQLLTSLVFDTHTKLHLILSSTQKLPFDTVRAKLEHGAIEFHARHLSFDRESTAQLLKQAGLSSASEQHIERIVSQTEGWPAAVRLMQMQLVAECDTASTPHVPDISGLLKQFSGDSVDMANLFKQRVLFRMAPELVSFMVEVSLLREFNAELLTYMTGQEKSSCWLEQLVAQNLLTFPLDGNRRWFRFHNLLREYLLAEASEIVSDDRRRVLLERAANWYLKRGEHVTAIGIALEAGATSMADELLTRMAHIAVGDQGQMGSLIQWVDRLLETGAQPSPEVHAWYVWALCDSLQYERAQKALDLFDRRIAEDSSYAGEELQIRLRFLRIMVNVFIDKLDDAYELAQAWLSSGSTADALTVAAVISFAAIAETDRGELYAARQRMDLAHATIARSNSAYGRAWVCILRACVEIGLARPDLADEMLRTERDSVVKIIGADTSVVVTLDFVHARALLDLGRLAEAQVLSSRGLPRSLSHGIVGTLEHGLIASIAFWGVLGDIEADSALLERAANSYGSRGPTLLAAAKVRRLLELGRSVDAQALANLAGLIDGMNKSNGKPMCKRGDWLLASLELMLARDACTALLEQTDALLKLALQQGRERDRIELLLIAAEAYERLGQHRAATRHFTMAVTLSAIGGLIQPFKARHSFIERLFSSHEGDTFGLIQPKERALLDRLRSLDPPLAAKETNETPAVQKTGLLNRRELQMLSLLDEGLNNEQVADRLALSVPTVKWHLHNAYVKLGVRNRSAALARSRALKLLTR